jgi:hypothetical protein
VKEVWGYAWFGSSAQPEVHVFINWDPNVCQEVVRACVEAGCDSATFGDRIPPASRYSSAY